MALRTNNVENISSRENVNSRLNTKVLLPSTKGALTKRTALGEVGNKLHDLHVQPPNKNAENKKTGVMAPPTALPKKAAIVAKKENVIKKDILRSDVSKKDIQKKPATGKEEAKSRTFKREDSLLKIGETNAIEKMSYSSAQLTIIDPDSSTKNEPQMVTEYLADIFDYLRHLECTFPIKENFLDNHQTTPKMRTILVNWLVEVHLNFQLCLETLHLCISIIDRYLQVNKQVGRDTLQLVGTSALLVASKYEEMYLPELQDFVYICDDIFSKKQILRMELEILSKIDFSLGRPLSVHFLRRYSKVAQVKIDQHTLGKYLLELALLEYNMSHIRPSIQAAAAICLSIAVLNNVMEPSKVWTSTLVHYTTYKYSDFKSTVIEIAHILIKAETSKYQAVKKKYSESKYLKISLNDKLRGPLIKKLTCS